MISDSLVSSHWSYCKCPDQIWGCVDISFNVFRRGSVLAVKILLGLCISLLYGQVCSWQFFLIQFWFFLLGRENCRQKEEQEGQMGVSHQVERLREQWRHLGTWTSPTPLWGIYWRVQQTTCYQRKAIQAWETGQHTKIIAGKPRVICWENIT